MPVLLIMLSKKYLNIRHRAPARLNTQSISRVDATLNSKKAELGLEKERTPKYMLDYMPESVALKLPVCNDSRLVADLHNSKVFIKSNTTYNIGQTISVSIILCDGYNKPLRQGGAILRARMVNLKKKAVVTGVITDHGNGSYTAEFEALWTGVSTITVQLSYPPEAIRAIYYMRQKLPGTRTIQAMFTAGNHSDVTNCHPTLEGVKKWNYSQICNFTRDNSGMLWFCGAPSNVNLLCEDWTHVQDLLPPPNLSLTPWETMLLNRTYKDIRQSVKVNIVRTNLLQDEIIPHPTTPCKDIDITSLWTRKQSTGYMFEDNWIMRHCKGLEDGGLFPCLRNRKFLFLGDSTVRQWYNYAMESWKCVSYTEKWWKVKWHKRAACRNIEHNFTAHWLPHSQPFFVFDLSRYTRFSIARHLDETGSSERVVAIIHVYLHTSFYHHSVFKRKISIIRESVENLINRNKFAKVFIKGPHTFEGEGNVGEFDSSRVCDYIGLLYRHIWFEVFAGLHDRVVFLDNADITHANAVVSIHPPDKVVGSMVSQMLAYLC